MGESPKTFNVVLRLFCVQFIVILISVLFMESFVGMISSNTGVKVYSTITAAIYLCVYYSKVWNAGRKDAKHVKVYNNHHEDKISVNNLKGLTVGILAAIPNIIALTAVAITKLTGSSYYSVANPILRILQTPFIGWMGNDNLTYIPNCVIITLLPIILSAPAYIAGVKNFSVTEKYLPMLVYKNNTKNNTNK